MLFLPLLVSRRKYTVREKEILASTIFRLLFLFLILLLIIMRLNCLFDLVTTADLRGANMIIFYTTQIAIG